MKNKKYTEKAKKKVLKSLAASKRKLSFSVFIIAVFIIGAVLSFKVPMFTIIFVIAAVAVVLSRPSIKQDIERYSYYVKEGIFYTDETFHTSGLPVENGVPCRLELRESVCQFKTPDHDYEIKYNDIDSVETTREEIVEQYLECNQEINYVTFFKTQVKTTAEIKERVVDVQRFLVINYKSHGVMKSIILKTDNARKAERLLGENISKYFLVK